MSVISFIYFKDTFTYSINYLSVLYEYSFFSLEEYTHTHAQDMAIDNNMGTDLMSSFSNHRA